MLVTLCLGLHHDKCSAAAACQRIISFIGHSTRHLNPYTSFLLANLVCIDPWTLSVLQYDHGFIRDRNVIRYPLY